MKACSFKSQNEANRHMEAQDLDPHSLLKFLVVQAAFLCSLVSSGIPSPSIMQAMADTTEQPVAGTNRIIVGHVNCWKCGSDGHYASVCPNTIGRTGYQGFQHVFAQTAIDTKDTDDIIDGMLNENWILIDSGLTFNSFMNPNLLGYITMYTKMRVYSNGGHLEYAMDAGVNVLPALCAYHSKDSLVYILMLSSLTACNCVVMDS